MTFPAFHVPNILAFQMNEPCFHSISLGARYEPDRTNLSSLRFPKFPPKKVLFGVCHRLCGYCLSTVYYTARTFACSSDLDSGHSHHRYVIASQHIQRTISYIFYDLGFALPTLPGFIQRYSVTYLCMQEIRLFVSTQHDGYHSEHRIFSCNFQKKILPFRIRTVSSVEPLGSVCTYRETCRTFDIVCSGI